MADPNYHLDAGLILDIANGLSTGAEREQALRHLRSCSQCEEAFRACLADVEGLRSEPVPQSATREVETLRASDSDPTSLWQKISNRLRPPRVRIVFGMAATVAIVLLAVRFQGGSPEVPAYWIERDQEFLQLRSSATDTRYERLWSGIDAYERKEAGEAVELLDGAVADGGIDDLRRIYLASALTLENRFEEALAVLQGFRPETLPYPWRSDALWIKYTALIGTGKDKEGALLLEDLADDPGVVGDLARREMERLGLDRLR